MPSKCICFLCACCILPAWANAPVEDAGTALFSETEASSSVQIEPSTKRLDSHSGSTLRARTTSKKSDSHSETTFRIEDDTDHTSGWEIVETPTPSRTQKDPIESASIDERRYENMDSSSFSKQKHSDDYKKSSDDSKTASAAEKKYTDLNSNFNRLTHDMERVELELQELRENFSALQAHCMHDSTVSPETARSTLQSQKTRSQSAAPIEEKKAKKDVEPVLDDAHTYQSAFRLLTQRRYTQASDALLRYKTLFPKGQYIDDADYWLAEIHMNQKRMEQAESAFQNFITHHPHSKKIWDARLKLAMIHVGFGKISAARQEFEWIKKNHPNSIEAQLASVRLQQLDQKKLSAEHKKDQSTPINPVLSQKTSLSDSQAKENTETPNDADLNDQNEQVANQSVLEMSGMDESIASSASS